MTRLNRFLTLAVAGALAAVASCGGDGDSPVGPPPPTFDLLTGCSGTCVAGLVTMVDGFQDIIRWVARGADSTAADRFFDRDTGAFGFDFDMDGQSGDEIQLRGMIRPIADSLGDRSCDNGMLDYTNKVCIAEWDMWHAQTAEQMGEGTFSNVFLGWAGSPLTPSFRTTIVTENPWMKTVDGCRLDITAMQLMTHPFGDPRLVSALVTFRMTSEGVIAEVNGDLVFAYDPSASAQSMSMTGQYTVDGTTTDIACTVNLDTFAVSCS